MRNYCIRKLSLSVSLRGSNQEHLHVDVREMRNSSKTVAEKSELKNLFEDLGINGRVIIR
jgi:hypothetical protein